MLDRPTWTNQTLPGSNSFIRTRPPERESIRQHFRDKIGKINPTQLGKQVRRRQSYPWKQRQDVAGWVFESDPENFS